MHRHPSTIPKDTRLTRLIHALHNVEHKAAAKVTVGAHLAYYGLVSMEAHGHYRYAAAVVGCLMLLEAVMGNGDGPGPVGGAPA